MWLVIRQGGSGDTSEPEKSFSEAKGWTSGKRWGKRKMKNGAWGNEWWQTWLKGRRGKMGFINVWEIFMQLKVQKHMGINMLLLDSSWMESRGGKYTYISVLPLLRVGIVHVPFAAVQLLVTNWLWSDQHSAWTRHYGSNPTPETHRDTERA